MLSEIFDAASITRVAIIDDDLSTKISLEDIKNAEENDDTANLLNDLDDPDREALINVLKDAGWPVNETAEVLAQALENEHIREKAPDRLKEAAENVLSKRTESAKPIEQLCQWLKNEGLDSGKFSVYTSPSAVDEDLDLDARFDLVLIDYFLVGNDNTETLPLIKKLISRHSSEENPLLIILMSSHDDQLKKDFSKLRPVLGITSSRFRIMQKPMTQSNTERIRWLLTLEQIALERSITYSIENFITSWGDKIKKAADNLASGLWELDAHSLEILRQAAENDHAHFEDYLAEILSRRVLAEIEENKFPTNETKELAEQLKTQEENIFTSGTEIGDSRLALRKLLGDISWRREGCWEYDELPHKDHKRNRFNWIKKNIQFGSILRNRENGQFLAHVTQSCDLAHINFKDRSRQHLLFFPGKLNNPNHHSTSNKQVLSSAYLYEEDWHNVHWALTQPLTLPVDNLVNNIENYEIVGLLRKDSAQDIITSFASQSARVGTLRIPEFSHIEGTVIYITKNSHIIRKKANLEFTGHLHKIDNKSEFINFDLDTAVLISENIDDNAIDKKELVSKLIRRNKKNTTLYRNGLSFIFADFCKDYREALQKAKNGKLNNQRRFAAISANNENFILLWKKK